MKGISQSDLERIAAEKGLDITVSKPIGLRLTDPNELPVLEELPDKGHPKYMADLSALMNKKKPSKHRNILTEIDGLLFHSKKEARRYLDLREQQRAGAITELATQVNFPICVNQILVTTYIADFTYRYREGNKIVEDVKSSHTRKMDVYRIKKKLMKAVLGIEIVEIL
jgi:hypothetical protein